MRLSCVFLSEDWLQILASWRFMSFKICVMGGGAVHLLYRLAATKINLGSSGGR